MNNHIGLYIFIGAGILLFIILIMMYNSLIYRKNQVENIKSSVDVMLKKRFDLIPNLVNSVKAYMKHEREVLEKITELRSLAGKEDDLSKKMDIEKKLNGYLKTIWVNVENYPELKANQNFLQLQAKMSKIEDEIAAARRAYNQAVTDYNNAIEMFPTNILASFMNFKKEKTFEIPEEERSNPNVKNLFKE